MHIGFKVLLHHPVLGPGPVKTICNTYLPGDTKVATTIEEVSCQTCASEYRKMRSKAKNIRLK